MRFRVLIGVLVLILGLPTAVRAAELGIDDDNMGQGDVLLNQDSVPGAYRPPAPYCPGGRPIAGDLVMSCGASRPSGPADDTATGPAGDPADVPAGTAPGGPGDGAPATPPAPPSGSDLSTILVSQINPPAPDVRTASPADQYVGIPMWMWVTNWEPTSVVLEAGGVRATVTATPHSTTWALTESTIECDGPGEPFIPDQSDIGEPSLCSYPFRWASTDQPDGRYPARTTTTWDVTWSATDGTSGTFGTMSTWTDFTIRVREAQAVTD